MKNRNFVLAIVLLLITCVEFFPQIAIGVIPAPDGGYARGNTAEGENALLSLTIGGYNTAAGLYSLASITTANFNTAIGAGTLFANTADENTATGAAALLSNTTGSQNTASGAFALLSNTEGVGNTATGAFALRANIAGNGNTASGNQSLQSNLNGSFNTATGNGALFTNNADGNTANGYEALFANTNGVANTATGKNALRSNNSGNGNTANGNQSLQNNLTGSLNTATGNGALFNNNADANTADGYEALFFNTNGYANTAIGKAALRANTNGVWNTAIGYASLYNTTGSYNIGLTGGSNLTSGDFNIYIGNDGEAAESGHIRIGSTCCQTQAFIAGIHGAVVSGGSTVYVKSDGQLGTNTSSIRFKDEVRPMDTASEAILALRPVSFRYKKKFDPNRIPQFGLVAEEVEKINPDLVVHDAKGDPYSVRYEQINAMLLNEFLKEHRKVEEQQATIARLRTEMQSVVAHLKQQDLKLKKVSAHLQLSKAAPQLVNNE